MAEQDQRITEAIKRDQSRLLNFIRRRVPDPRDAEDVLQDVFYKLVEANRLLMPIDHITGWLFRVARNRIVDLWREKKRAGFDVGAESDGEGLPYHARSRAGKLRYGEEGDEMLRFEELLPSRLAGPEAVYVRNALLEELESALAELPKDQREVFLAHEIEGRNFKEMAAETGVSMNTLLSRKRYAVLRLRQRLQDVYEEFGEGL